MPVMFSEPMGFRLCGIADDPFWLSAKASETSRISLRCKWRISVAKRSNEAPVMAIVARNSAWRSRWVI